MFRRPTPSRFPTGSCFIGGSSRRRPPGGEARSTREFVSEHQEPALESNLHRVHVRALGVAARDAFRRHRGSPVYQCDVTALRALLFECCGGTRTRRPPRSATFCRKPLHPGEGRPGDEPCARSAWVHVVELLAARTTLLLGSSKPIRTGCAPYGRRAEGSLTARWLRGQGEHNGRLRRFTPPAARAPWPVAHSSPGDARRISRTRLRQCSRGSS